MTGVRATEPAIKVLVVDDQQLVRRGICLVLDTLEGVEVVGEAADGREGLAMINAVQPDVVLTDARMPVLDGVGLVAGAASLFPGLPVVVLTTFDDDELVRTAIDAGACGFLLKDAAPDDIARSLEAALRGELAVDPRVTRSLVRRPAVDPLRHLTPTEAEVAARIAVGESNAEIAAALRLSHGTVKNHTSALLRKLGQPDRTRLALYLAALPARL
jgi:DNA-binding NarL/FixJ family response regulator